MPITADQIASFHRRGVLRLENFLSEEKVSHVRHAAFTKLEKHGFWQENKWKLDGLADFKPHEASARIVKSIGKIKEFKELIRPECTDAIRSILLVEPVAWLKAPQLLFTVPQTTDRWTIPHNVWHLDLVKAPNKGIRGVQVFTFLDTVMPGGGGTLAVAGSHRMLEGISWIGSKQAKRRLKREPYFKSLMSANIDDRMHFLRENCLIGDVELQVVEMHGVPGDIYLMDLRILHAPAPNALSMPRMMLTERFVKQDYLDEIKEIYQL